jgi:hypothetical protein
MSSPSLLELLSQSAFCFVGTVQHLGASTMRSIPIDDYTTVVRVDAVLRVPSAVSGLVGQLITLQLLASLPLPAEGNAYTFFAEGLAFGESMAVQETARRAAAQEPPVLAAVMEPGFEPPAAAQAALDRQIAALQLRAHAETANAVVLGRVIGLVKVAGQPLREHSPDWWVATVDVYAVEKGSVALGPLGVLYANSQDVQWRTAPKPRASQGGLWLLHATEGALAELAAYRIIHPEDLQPTQALDDLRGEGS